MARTDKIYNRLVETVLTTRVRRESRDGRTISCFGASICLPIHTEFPLLTTRKIFFNGVFGELAAFITGSTILNTFKEFRCNYWDMNAAAWERNKDVPQSQQVVGHIYGYQWRNWAGHYDQLYRLVEGINLDPYGRRHLLTTWDPADLKNMCLPPCHLLAQFYVHDGALSCLVFMRSVDLALGLPSDMILYATLQAAHAEVSVAPDGGAGLRDLGSAHGTFVRLPARGERRLGDVGVVRVGSQLLRASLS